MIYAELSVVTREYRTQKHVQKDTNEEYWYLLHLRRMRIKTQKEGVSQKESVAHAHHSTGILYHLISLMIHTKPVYRTSYYVFRHILLLSRYIAKAN